MRKLLLILSIVLLATTAKAQTSGAVVTTVPASFTALDQVKIIVDVSAVGNLAGQEPLYVWTWFPNEPAPGNGAWDNSNEARKMVKEGPNRWSWTLTPADFYGVPPGSITEIKFLVKAKNANGDKKTDDITLPVAPLIYIPATLRTFPSVVGQNELITVFLDQKLATDLTTQRMTPNQAEVKLFNGNTQVGTTKNFNLTAQGDKVFSFYTLPKTDFVIPAGVMVTKMTVTYKGTMPDNNGVPVSASSITFEKLFDDLK